MKRTVDGRYFMSCVKIGAKGQIVIPKEARDMFNLTSGDTMVVMADKERGIALQTVDKLEPFMRSMLDETP